MTPHSRRRWNPIDQPARHECLTAVQRAYLRDVRQSIPGLFAAPGYSCGVKTTTDTGRETPPHHDQDYDSNWLDFAVDVWEDA